MTAKTTEFIRIECKCKTCKINAEKVGASFPLKADITPAFAEVIGKKVHDTVYIAHEPGAFGEALRRQGNIHPVL